MKKEKVNKKQQVEMPKEELVSQDQNIEEVMKINKSTLKDLLAPSGIDASHFDYLEIFSKVSDCMEHKASVIPIEVTGNICFFKY